MSFRVATIVGVDGRLGRLFTSKSPRLARLGPLSYKLLENRHLRVAVRRPNTDETVAVAHSAAELLVQLELAPRALLQDGWRSRSCGFRPIL